MTTEAILEVIYNYYPKNISSNDVEAYDTSIEFHNRLRKCREAKQYNDNWEKLKQEVGSDIFEEYEENIHDYSVLGSEPCYSASIGIGNSQEPLVISILISVIVPLWTYRIVDIESVHYKYRNEREEKIIIQLKYLIEKYFPGYDFVDENQHQVVIPNVDTIFRSNPTILNAIFKEDLN